MRNKLFSLLLGCIITIIVGLLILLLVMSATKQWSYPNITNIWSLDGWKYHLENSVDLLSVFIKTIFIALCTSIINIVIGIPAADVLGRGKLKHKGFVEALLMIPLFIPPIVILFATYGLFLRIGLTGTYVGVIIAHVIPTLPYMIRSVKPAYAQMGFNYYHQGISLGASPLRTFYDIELPIIMPHIFTGVTLTFLISMSQYLLTLFVGNGTVNTFMVYLVPFIQSGSRMIGVSLIILYVVLSVLGYLITVLVTNRLLRRTH